MDDSCKDSIPCKAVRKSFEITAKKGLDVLDLNRKEIQQIPSGLDKLDLSSLKYLYLEGNVISLLPEDFFTCLSSLEWFDLRNNKLCEVPRTIGEHKNLKTLLLGRNQLTSLPVEIGFLKTLTGLNLSDNPLDDPPQTVITSGVYAIKSYLLAKLGINPDDFQSDETESEYQSTESGENSQEDGDEVKKGNDDSEDKKEESTKSDVTSNDRHTEAPQPTTESVHPKVAMSYYGALLGDIPNSYIFKPWKTGVFFKKEEMGDKLSTQNLEPNDSKEH